ncbi:MAG: DUF3179 domain-containing protein [Actinomycetia bacterium]|nr:DUF3179 domain-containing protein [Actinomycetes bacterium]
MTRRRFAALTVATALTAAACGGSDAAESSSETPLDQTLAPATTTTTDTGPADDIGDGDETEAPFLQLELEEKIDAFQEAPNSVLATNVATEMALDGDKRWGPWLLDLLRMGDSTALDDQVAGALEIISGVDNPGFITESYRVYGQWVTDEDIDPGPGYRDWKMTLLGQIDEEFAVLLDGVTDDRELSLIQWGGVTRGGIPELNHQERVPASEADWMTDDEIVFAVEVDDIAVAYPFRILGHHELANDTIGDTPVSLVFCTLCRTALLFDRRVEGRVLDFQTSGLLTNSNKIMVDNQTDTLWSHLLAKGISGPLKGIELDQHPVEATTWADWAEANPDGETLTIPSPIFFPGQPERPPIAYEYDPESAYDFYYNDPDVWFPILDTPNESFPLKTEVLGIEIGGAELALQVEALAGEGPRVFVAGDTPLLVVPNGAGARVYDGSDLDLADGDRPEIITETSGGVELADGSALPRLVVDQGFWFAWFNNHPNTQWWPRAE